MGGRRSAPRVINTPTGPRRSRKREDQPSPITRTKPISFPRDIRRPVVASDERRNTFGMADDMPEGIRKRREETSGDSFRETRRDRRRMAGDKKDYFGRVRKGFFGITPKRPAPDTRDRVPNDKTRKVFDAMFDRGFGMTINMSKDATPDQRKAAFDKLLEERRGSMRPFPTRRNQDQNIAKTDV